jgi:hypothetical protein
VGRASRILVSSVIEPSVLLQQDNQYVLYNSLGIPLWNIEIDSHKHIGITQNSGVSLIELLDRALAIVRDS